MYRFNGVFFYPYDLKSDYEASGAWPEDGLDVSDEVFNEFAGNAPPEGKVLGVGASGEPVWEDAPLPTEEALATQARAERNRLLSEVDSISPVRWAGMTKAEQDGWVAYRQALLDVPQQEGFPNDIIWPDRPN